MKLKNVKLYYYIYRVTPYLIFLNLALNSLFNIDPLINLLTTGLLIILFVISLIQYNRLAKKIKNEEEIELDKLQNVAKNMESSSSSITPEFARSFIKEMLFSSKDRADIHKLFLDNLLEKNNQESEAILSNIQKNYFKNMHESLGILLNFINVEEYELIKFLSIKKKQNFLFWSIIQVIVISISLVFGFLYAFFLLSNFFHAVLFILCFSFKDIKRFVKKKFHNGLNRYQKNRKIFIDYQINFNLLCNNHRLHSFKQFEEIASLLKLANNKINYYKGIIKPYYFYVQKYEIVGFLGIIVVIVSVIIQEIIIQMPSTLFNFDMKSIFFFLLLIYGFIYLPISQYRKSTQINILNDEKGKKLNKNLETLKEMQYLFIHNSKNQNQ